MEYNKGREQKGNRMIYKEYTVFTATEELDRLVDRLNCLGKTDIIINDPRDAEAFTKDGGLNRDWNFVSEDVIRELESGAKVTFYTGEKEVLPEAVAQLLQEYDTRVARADDQDWLHKWEEYYIPTKIGERTVSKPVWKEYQAKADEIIIDIDPGMAFGTGSSPTTYLAVRFMEKYVKPGDTVLDVGCGTGILSVLGAKLGASHVDGVDLDPEAVASTIRNVQLNQCEKQVSVYHGDLLRDFDFTADVIVANLTADLLALLCDGLADHCNPKGLFIASGIIDFKEEFALTAIQNAGFEVLETVRDDCWVAAITRLKKQ